MNHHHHHRLIHSLEISMPIRRRTNTFVKGVVEVVYASLSYRFIAGYNVSFFKRRVADF
jgi:hypothetical protein